ncbi:MAG TPA: MurR/RpiR family transcriptional regulator [Actinoallomurus sp.]|nr:MurR/RpiR family transcriptional regulator [Actinoallomurus sp.]
MATDHSPGRQQDALTILRGLQPSLVPSKRRVAAYILRKPAHVATQTISELARAAQTSESTVLRLCQELGLRGYRELRIALAAESGREQERAANRDIGSDISRDDDLDSIIDTVTFTDQQAIADTARNLDRAALAEAVTLTAGARRVDIVGIGASAVVALDLHQKLHRIGLIAYAWHDTHAALTAAALLGPADVAIGVSHTGTTPETVDVIHEAIAHGALTIALTGVPKSPLAAAADVLLTTVDRETTFRSGATASRIAALSVVDVVFTAVAQRRYDQAIAALEATRHAIVDRRATRTTPQPHGGKPAERSPR